MSYIIHALMSGLSPPKVFGRVTSGMDVVQSIENVVTDKLDCPTNQVIKIMSVGLQ